MSADCVIDCSTCTVRGLACDECVVTVLVGHPPGTLELDDEERAAVDLLSRYGLVPPLRLRQAQTG